MFGRAGLNFGRMGATGHLWALAGSTLDLEFTKSRGWQSGTGQKAAADFLTTTRASNAYADDTAGNWSLFSSGVPRITDRGLLVEEARTNSIRNNSMQGAVAGTPGTAPTNWAVTTTGGVFTRTIVGTGTESGIDYIETRIQASGSGTFTFQFDGGAVIAALLGQTWVNAAFSSLTGGTLTNISEVRLGISENDSGGVFLAENTTAFTPTNASLSSQRRAHTRTLNNASTAFVVSTLQVVFTGAGDITLRIGWPQLELGSFATSPIRTTSAAAARAADVVSASVAFGSAYTLFAQAVPNAPAAYAVQQNVIQAGSNAQRLVMRRVATNGGRLATLVGGTGGQILSNATEWVAGTRSKWATAVEAASQASSVDGAAPSTATVATLPTTPTIIYLGVNSAGTEFFNGWLERAAVFATTRFTNAQLQALTQ